MERIYFEIKLYYLEFITFILNLHDFYFEITQKKSQ